MKLSNFNLHSVFFFIPITHDLFVEVIYKRQIPEKLALHQMLRHFPRLAQNQILYRFGKKVKYILGCRFMHQKQKPIEQSRGKSFRQNRKHSFFPSPVLSYYVRLDFLLYFCSSMAAVPSLWRTALTSIRFTTLAILSTEGSIARNDSNAIQTFTILISIFITQPSM